MYIAKFKLGDLVKVTDKMPDEMSHFRCGGYAIVSERDAFISKSEPIQYALRFLPYNDYSAWYDEEQLTFVMHIPLANELLDIIEHLTE